MVGCGFARGGSAKATGATGGFMPGVGQSTAIVGSGAHVDRNVITGGETSPHVTQSETMIARIGNTVVVAFNDSRDSPSNYSGVSRSTDGGATFTRLLPSPFASGHGTNYGDPMLVYNRKLGIFVAGFIAGGCGAQGLGTWTSTDGLNWATASCAHSGSTDDRPSLWVDNNPFSAHFGRLYVSFNDFSVGAGALEVVTSDDAITWSAPVIVNASFIRDVQITGSLDSDGRVYLMAMNEGGGAFAARQNVLFYSTDGGGTWTQVIVGDPFAASGDGGCGSYFVMQHPIWRDMGWGQPAAGPGGLVAYDYTAHGAGADPGDIYFTRSTDYGATWSAPLKLNGDSSGNGQWQPSLAITDTGEIVASWYDRRNSTDGSNYEIFYRVSRDRGNTWSGETRLSDVLIPQPVQPDPSVQSCYAGDYNNAVAYQHTVHMGWTDGRVNISGNQQQDVFVDQFSTIPVLYDQYDTVNGSGIVSEDFATNNPLDCQAADDFVVPSGQLWWVSQIEVAGFGLPPPRFNVFIYNDASGLPGTQVFTQTGIAPTLGPSLNGVAGTSVALPLSGGTWLVSGHYWISVQSANTDSVWFSFFRTVTAGSVGVWRNPANGFATGCTGWGQINPCLSLGWAPDLVFRLDGYATSGMY